MHCTFGGKKSPELGKKQAFANGKVPIIGPCHRRKKALTCLYPWHVKKAGENGNGACETEKGSEHRLIYKILNETIKAYKEAMCLIGSLFDYDSSDSDSRLTNATVLFQVCSYFQQPCLSDCDVNQARMCMLRQL